MPAAQIIGNLLDASMNKERDVSLNFKLESADAIKRAINDATWTEVQGMNLSLIPTFARLLKFKKQSHSHANLLLGLEERVKDYLLKSKNHRTLHNDKLIKLVEIISMLPKQEQFDKVLSTLLHVLGTLNLELVPIDITSRRQKEEALKDQRIPDKIPYVYKDLADWEGQPLPLPVVPTTEIPEFDFMNQRLSRT